MEIIENVAKRPHAWLVHPERPERNIVLIRLGAAGCPMSAAGAKHRIEEFCGAGFSCGEGPLDIMDIVMDRYITIARSA